MKLSLSKREKVLIVGSLIAMILFVYISLVRPGLKLKLEDQEARQANLRIQVTSMDNAAARLTQLEEEKQILEVFLEEELASYFGTEMKQENVLLLVRDLLEMNGIDAYEMALDEEGSSRLRDGLESFFKQNQQETGQTEAESGSVRGEGMEGSQTASGTSDRSNDFHLSSVRMISVSMRFRSDFRSMMNFIQAISSYPKKIGIESLTLEGGGEDLDRPIEGTIRFFLPALQMVEGYFPTELPGDLEKGMSQGTRKEDPFDYGGRYITPEETEAPPEEDHGTEVTEP